MKTGILHLHHHTHTHNSFAMSSSWQADKYPLKGRGEGGDWAALEPSLIGKMSAWLPVLKTSPVLIIPSPKLAIWSWQDQLGSDTFGHRLSQMKSRKTEQMSWQHLNMTLHLILLCRPFVFKDILEISKVSLESLSAVSVHLGWLIAAHVGEKTQMYILILLKWGLLFKM